MEQFIYFCCWILISKLSNKNIFWTLFVSSLRHVLNLFYPLLLRPATFPKTAIREIISQISLLIDLMTGSEDGGSDLDEEALFELLEIGLYVIYLLTKSEKDIVVSRVFRHHFFLPEQMTKIPIFFIYGMTVFRMVGTFCTQFVLNAFFKTTGFISF